MLYCIVLKHYPTFEELELDESKMSDRKEEHIEITSLIIYIIINWFIWYNDCHNINISNMNK